MEILLSAILVVYASIALVYILRYYRKWQSCYLTSYHTHYETA